MISDAVVEALKDLYRVKTYTSRSPWRRILPLRWAALRIV